LSEIPSLKTSQLALYPGRFTILVEKGNPISVFFHDSAQRTLVEEIAWHLTWIKNADAVPLRYAFMDWQPVSTAPFDRDLELAVIDRDGMHALVFPCRRILGSWIDAETTHRIDISPTHWREWKQTP